MAQAQCPNCGGYKITYTDITRLVPATSKEKVKRIVRIQVLVVVLCVIYVIGDSMNQLLPRLSVDWGCLSIAVVLDFIISVWAFTRKSTKTVGYRYSCELCGYQWDWYIGTPWPEVTTRPDLIAKGAQRLQQQEEEEARKYREALAAWYLTHQKK